MELNMQIKKHRTEMNLSQEQLAEKLYVTRQTISNWETGKNYPDIHSLLLMSSLFGVTLDQLMKGDYEMMKKEIKAEDIKKFRRDSVILTILLLMSALLIAPLVYFLEFIGIMIAVLIFGITLGFAVKMEKYKKENDIQTYKEIVSFLNGKRLDEIEKHQEFGKRPYQAFVLALACGLITFVIGILVIKLSSIII